MQYATATWYADASEGHCCGMVAEYGVATCGDQVPVCYPQGTRIEFVYGGRQVVATVDDHGPYANGAAFDLGSATKDALGFDGVATVGYRVLRR